METSHSKPESSNATTVELGVGWQGGGRLAFVTAATAEIAQPNVHASRQTSRADLDLALLLEQCSCL